MRKFKLKKWVAAGLMASLPYAGAVDAAGLGRLNVLSQLGQPFSAEIDLVNVTKEELASLKANLATPAAYQAANLQFNPALNALRLSVERRANGTPYIKATSFRPVSEPYLDLLVELVWQGGRLSREYSALLDPPGMETPAPGLTAPTATAPTTTQAAPAAPATTEPKSAATPAPTAAPARAQTAAPVRPKPAAAGQYAVKNGDTLSGIARQVGPEGVSLEQTLVGLYRANPDAFIGNNINQLRAGKILNVPEREQLAAIAQGEAAQEVRVHASNWNNYRQQVAQAAPAVADAAPASKGKIATRADDKAASASPKDVVVLSKGDTGPGGAGKGGKSRERALEEDLAARDKALAESKERIAALEKTLKDMQKLAEIKSQTLTPPVPAGKAPDVKAAAPEVAKAEPPKADATKSEPPKAEAPKAEPPKEEAKAPDAPKADVPPPKPVAAAPKKVIAPPPPPPEPSLMDTVMENIVPIGGGAAALLAGIGGIWALRRRKQNEVEDDEPVAPRFKSEPTPVKDDTIPGAIVASEPTVSNVSEVVDPIDEAQVYIDHGRDAQAEEILKEAMGKFPEREDVPLKLLEVYAARSDKAGFNALAQDFHKQTGGMGEKWGRAAALGYALDPTNPLYPSTGEVVDLAAHRDSAAVDLDLGGAAPELSTTTDILLDQPEASVDMDKTMVLTRDTLNTSLKMAVPEPEVTPGALPDFNIEFPTDTPTSTVMPTQTAEPEAPISANMLEFNIDLPAEPAADAKPAAPAAAAMGDAGLDFKVDFSNINLNLDDAPAASPVAGAKDAHWEDVQQKFDLARAYQEMGDKEGALEILREVEREGDDGQKAEAHKMIQSIK